MDAGDIAVNNTDRIVEFIKAIVYLTSTGQIIKSEEYLKSWR